VNKGGHNIVHSPVDHSGPFWLSGPEGGTARCARKPTDLFIFSILMASAAPSNSLISGKATDADHAA
jgi:hypothetical protein